MQKYCSSWVLVFFASRLSDFYEDEVSGCWGVVCKSGCDVDRYLRFVILVLEGSYVENYGESEFYSSSVS